MKRVALYARVSTSNHHQDPEMQLRDLRTYCAQHQFDVVGEYVDRGFCGATKSRPELDRLMADAEQHHFDAVAVWKFDRFARSALQLATALEKFQVLGIGFVSFTEQVDTATPAGKLVFTILGAVAEMERDMIRERIKAGLRNAVAKGHKLGRKRLPVEAAEVRQAVDGGLSVQLAAKRLGISYGTAWALNKEARA